MSDEAVKKALDGVVRFPSRARVALLNLSPERQSYRYYGSNYWQIYVCPELAEGVTDWPAIRMLYRW